jgi:molecular chaperone GrpE
METNNNKNNLPNQEETTEHTSVISEGEAQEFDHQKAAIEAAQKAEKEILYIRAEFDNYKKRLIKDQENAIKMANKNMVSELLTVLDLFEHAIAHSSKLKTKGDTEVTNFVTGIEMTRSELAQLMGRFGVELIGQVGENFDPAKHEAISEMESKEQPANTVLSVVQKGCLLHGKLLKPARVVVVKAS